MLCAVKSEQTYSNPKNVFKVSEMFKEWVLPVLSHIYTMSFHGWVEIRTQVPWVLVQYSTLNTPNALGQGPSTGWNPVWKAIPCKPDYFISQDDLMKIKHFQFPPALRFSRLPQNLFLYEEATCGHGTGGGNLYFWTNATVDNIISLTWHNLQQQHFSHWNTDDLPTEEEVLK